MKKLSFLILTCFFSLFVFSQDNQFLLYSFKGNVSVVENSVESKAKIGKTMDSKAQVKVGPGSMVTLICNEASMFTLAKAGTYPMSRISDSCKTTTASSVSANYVKYVWNQMTKSAGSPGSNRKAYMNTVGAVTRSINNVWIDPRLDTVNYSGGDFPLSWKSYADAKEYEFMLFTPDNIGSPLYKNTVSKLKIPITDFASKIKPGSSYFWTAMIKGEDNDDLKVLNYVTKDTYNAVLEKFKAQTGAFEAPAEQAYRLAFMLEDAHYLAEAYQYYMKATTLAPDNALYRATFMSFKKDYEIK